MKNKKVLLVVLAITLVLGMTVVGCDNGGSTPQAKYYVESGTISTTAYNLINTTPGISAEQALAYCNQYPVSNDKYKNTESGITRSELEDALNNFSSVPGFSKTQFLHMLDSTGGVFQMFTTVTNEIIYIYVAKQ